MSAVHNIGGIVLMCLYSSLGKACKCHGLDLSLTRAMHANIRTHGTVSCFE